MPKKSQKDNKNTKQLTEDDNLIELRDFSDEEELDYYTKKNKSKLKNTITNKQSKNNKSIDKITGGDDGDDDGSDDEDQGSDESDNENQESDEDDEDDESEKEEDEFGDNDIDNSEIVEGENDSDNDNDDDIDSDNDSKTKKKYNDDEEDEDNDELGEEDDGNIDGYDDEDDKKKSNSYLKNCYSKYVEEEDDEIDLENINSNFNLIQHEKISKNFMTRYEFVRLIGTRTNQLENGAKPLIKDPGNMKFSEIALHEIKTKVLPLIIERPVPNSEPEKWKVKDLIIPEELIEELTTN